MVRFFLVVGSFVAGLLVVSCKDDSSSGTSAPADGGASSSTSSSSSSGSTSSTSSSGGSSGTDSGSTCGMDYEPAAAAGARFEGWWLIDDGNGGACNNASLFEIVEGTNTTNVTDPEKTSCTPPAMFMWGYQRKAKDCLLVPACQSEPAFVFFAHARAVNATVTPNELILLPDGSGSYKLSTSHITKSATGINAFNFDYTPSSMASNICP